MKTAAATIETTETIEAIEATAMMAGDSGLTDL
jgi:hypothetical protein